MLNLGGTISLQIFTNSKNKTLEKKKLNSELTLASFFFYFVGGGGGGYDFLTFAFGGSWYFVTELEGVRCFC